MENLDDRCYCVKHWKEICRGTQIFLSFSPRTFLTAERRILIEQVYKQTIKYLTRCQKCTHDIKLTKIAFMTNAPQQSCHNNLEEVLNIPHTLPSEKAKKIQKHVHFSQIATFLALYDTRSKSALAISKFIKHKKSEK